MTDQEQITNWEYDPAKSEKQNTLEMIYQKSLTGVSLGQLQQWLYRQVNNL